MDFGAYTSFRILYDYTFFAPLWKTKIFSNGYEADIIIAQMLFIKSFIRSLACLFRSCSWNAFTFFIVSYGRSLQLQFFFVRPFIAASVFSRQKLPRLVPIVIKLMLAATVWHAPSMNYLQKEFAWNCAL